MIICQIKYWMRLKSGIEKFANTGILIDTDDKLPENITLKNVVTCIIKYNDKFYLQLFLKEALLEA